MDAINLIVMLLVLLILAKVGGLLFERFNLPGMIGEIVVGILVANIFISQWGNWNLLHSLDLYLPGAEYPDGNQGYSVFSLFAELGIVFLLFTVGLETKVSDLFSVGRPALLAASFGILLPFSAGFLITSTYLFDNIYTCLFFATALITTSAGIAAHILKKLKICNSKEGRTIVGVAIVSEIITLLILAIVYGVARGNDSTEAVILIVFSAVMFIVVSLILSKYFVPRVTGFIGKHRGEEHPEMNMLLVGITACLALAILANSIGLSMIIGAFFAGMLFAEHAEDWGLIKEIEAIKEFFIAFFFIGVGMRISVSALASVDVLWIAALISVIAVACKFAGGFIGAKLGDWSMSTESANIVGWGIVPKAEVTIIVATMGATAGALSGNMFTAMILMTLITTTVAQLMIQRGITKKYAKENGSSDADPETECAI